MPTVADRVLYEVSEGLATIVLNRPDALNALDTAAKEELREATRRAADDPAVRAVLLTGNGRAFCVGQDLKEHIGTLAEARRRSGAEPTGDAEPVPGNTTSGDDAPADDAPGAATSPAAMDTVARHYTPITATLAGMPKPVVAAVNGVAAGAGAGFAFAADYRVVAETASFHTSFAGVALSTDSGVCWTLPRLIGRGRATDLLLFPRAVSAAEARELGIAQRVVPAEELRTEAEAVARRLAQGPTVAYASIKEALEYAAGHTLEETLAKEGELQARAGAAADHHIAVEAFVRKEEPRFLGR